ncbi:MAG: hypothetical protein KDC87_09950 [Planctomycetes bacterium]|nr:hypothetical protein [Planctomycetota bacterium]MCB9868473.1 hypothetical protein [Planctomycetota bacterium]
MQPDVAKLLELQKVDQRIARLRRQADSLPREQAKRQASLDTLRQGVETIKRERTEFELRSRELDMLIRQSDAEIRNLEGKLGLIKNNAEYQAILFQIEAVKKERDRYEEESLQLLDQSGPLEERLSQSQTAVAAEDAVFAEFLTKAQKLITEQNAEIAEVSRGRDALLEGIPVELVEEYERLFESREGLAICAAEAQYCQGCYTQFTVNDLAKLQGGRTVVRCSSCQRILYLPG